MISPKGFNWQDCEFNIECNHSATAAKLKNVTLGNTTSIYNLFHVAGRDLPKAAKSGLALAYQAAVPLLGPQVAPVRSLAALKDQAPLPAIKDASPQKTATGSPGKPKAPALDDKQQSQLTRGSDGVYRLVRQDGQAGKASGGRSSQEAVSLAAKKQAGDHPRTHQAAAPVKTPEANAAASSTPAATTSVTATAKKSPARTAAHKVSSQPESRGRSRSRSSRRGPPSPAATSVYPSEDESDETKEASEDTGNKTKVASEDESHEPKKAPSDCSSQSPVRHRRRRGTRRMILSPAQKNLRRLRGQRSLS